MKTVPFLNFSVDRANNKITVNREFAAPLDDVWSAWTQSEILDKWWAPKPYQAVTVSMDFSEGGVWHYYMLGPEGDRHYCRADYKSIVPRETFSALDAFCDESGNVNPDFPRSHWQNSFERRETTTMVNIVISYDKPEDMEKILEMGFEEGFKMGMENLDSYFEVKR